MRWLIPSLLAACLCACGKKDKSSEMADEPSAPAPSKPEVTLLQCFWDTTLNEHVYTYGDGEPANWRKNPVFAVKPSIGFVATKQYLDTVPLQRAYSRDRRHYFYINKPDGATDIERMEDFHVYVWTSPGDGRVPVHACFLPDHKDAYFEQNLKLVKDYVDGTLKGTGKKRYIAENYFYVYPTGSVPSLVVGQPLAAPPTPQADWVVGMWLGHVGDRTVSLRYYPDGYFEESHTGASGEAVYGTYTAQVVSNHRLEILRDELRTVVPEFLGPTSMTHPIGPSGERIKLTKVDAPKDTQSPLKQRPLSPEAEALRKQLIGQWKVKAPVVVGGQDQTQVLDYQPDGTFFFNIAVEGQPQRTIIGRWVVIGQTKDSQTGMVDKLTLSRFIDGKQIAPISVSFPIDGQISHNLWDTAEQAVFVRQE